MITPALPSIARQYLICRCGERLCALPLEHVAETMRAQPTRPVPSMPKFILGVALIRGATVPVVSMASLLDEAASDKPKRIVTLKVEDRAVALALDAVIGVRSLNEDAITDIPLLLQIAEQSSVVAIATLDSELLLVLQGMRIICTDAWTALDTLAISP